ncbi:MAG: sodium:solute symporter family protein [Clostridiales bacterium]|nr:sodium:solute symporter family protein [Clostridiales bacterium]
MPKEGVLYISIAVYAVMILGIGIFSARKSKSISDFTVGERKANAWMSAFSYGTTYFSAVMFIGYAGSTGWKYGLWGVLPGIGNAIFGSLFAWMVLAKRTRETTRRLEIKSMPQFFHIRFQSMPMKLFAVAIIFIFLLPYSASVYKGLTSVCSVLLGINEQVCMIIIAVAAAAIVILGGYVAMLKADFIQGIVMIVGICLLIFFIVRSQQVGGIAVGLSAIAKKTSQLGLTAKDHISLWATVLMTSFGTWGLPQMIHKYYGIRDDKEVRRGTIISTLFALLIAGGGYFIGSLSHLFFQELPQGGQDFLIPNMLLQSQLPTILLGVVLVLLIAASVSTLASITITASSTLTMDLVQTKIRPSMTSSHAAIFTKVLCGVFVGLSYLIANTNTPILDMMSYSWGILSGSFLAPYLITLYWKGINRAGAWAGMLGGFLVALPPVIFKLFCPTITLGVLGPVADMGAHFACASMAVSFLLCFVVSKIAKAAQWKSGAENPDFYIKKQQPAVSAEA